jgi:hypothetical protein
MKKPKQFQATVRPPCLILVANIRGGCGKTTVALTVADTLALAGHAVRPFQVDDQPQLARLMGQEVTSLLPDLGEVGTNPRALTAPFAPLYDACMAAPETGTTILVDVGANMVSALAQWLKDVALQEDLSAWGMTALILVPAVFDTAAVKGAIETLTRLRWVLPAAVPVFIENQRDKPFHAARPGTDIYQVLESELPPALIGCEALVMPEIQADAWQIFERAGIRFAKAVALAPGELATHLGECIAETKIMQSHVARYLVTMRRELAKCLDVSACDHGPA